MSLTSKNKIVLAVYNGIHDGQERKKHKTVRERHFRWLNNHTIVYRQVSSKPHDSIFTVFT